MKSSLASEIRETYRVTSHAWLPSLMLMENAGNRRSPIIGARNIRPLSDWRDLRQGNNGRRLLVARENCMARQERIISVTSRPSLRVMRRRCSGCFRWPSLCGPRGVQSEQVRPYSIRSFWLYAIFWAAGFRRPVHDYMPKQQPAECDSPRGCHRYSFCAESDVMAHRP